jgi:DtxR family Mn-dependent transcriptional regulator
MPSSTVENYIKHLYLEQQSGQGDRVATGRVASVMGVSPSTATAMIKSLASSGLVVYEPRVGITLTQGGERLALDVLRRHRLVELFLVKVLGVDWAWVHDEAENLEHAISARVLEKIDEFLNHPRFDPHGDPIPSVMGQIAAPELTSLKACDSGNSVRIARLVNQDARFLEFLKRNGLTPGITVSIEDRDPVADTVTLRPDGGDPVTLGTAAVDKIMVQSVETTED